MFNRSFIRFSRIALWNYNHRKNCVVVSGLILQKHRAFKLSLTLCQELRTRKWMKPNIKSFVRLSSLKLIAALLGVQYGPVHEYRRFCSPTV